MNELENRLVAEYRDYDVHYNEYDSYMNALAERDDKNYDENI